jgi:CheY-specific phosphatase CheX
MLEALEKFKDINSFSILEKGRYYCINFFGSVSKDENNLLHEHFTHIVLNPKNVFVNCLLIGELSLPLMMTLNLLNKQMLSEGKVFKLMNCSQEMEEKVKMVKGVFDNDSFFIPDLWGGIKSLLKETEDPPKYSFVGAIVLSTTKTLYVQTKLITARRKTYFKEELKGEFTGDISSILKVKVEEKYYWIAISFAEKAYLKIMSTMLGEKIDAIDEDVQDGVSEILSIIIGQTKSLMTRKDEKIAVNFPRSITGKECPPVEQEEGTFSFEESTVFVIPFTTNKGNFNIEMAFPKEYSTQEINEMILK